MGGGISFVSLIQGAYSNELSGAGVTSNLNNLIPPDSGKTGLPKICFNVQVVGNTENLCMDFNEYSWVFDVIGIFMLFGSVFTSYKIVIGV